MSFWTTPSDFANAANSFRETKQCMEYLEKEIGVPYPWAKYDQVCVQDFTWGGMENTSMTTLNVSTLFDKETENLRSSQGLVAHELAHQWFGDLVTCKDWSHTWLNEGFATYYTHLFAGHKDGRDTMLHGLYRDLKRLTGRTNDTTAMVNRKYKDREGNQKEETTFVDCEAWGKTAETMAKYLSKGKPVFLEGRLKLDQWQDKDGNNRSKLKLVIENFQFIDSRGNQSAEPPPAAANAATAATTATTATAAAPTSASDTNEIPF